MNDVAPILRIPIPLLIAVALYLLFWQGYKLRRNVSGLARVSLLVTVVGGQLPPVLVQLAALGALSSSSQVVIIGNALLGIPAVGLACFRHALLGRSAASPAVGATVGLGLLTVAADVALGLIAIDRGVRLAIGGSAVEGAVDPAAAAFYVLPAFAYGAALLYLGSWFFRYTRTSRPRFRFGMRLAAVGVLVLGVGVTLRGLAPAVVFSGGPPPPVGLSAILLALSQYFAFVSILGGLSFPLVAARVDALRAWRRSSADYHRLLPLCEVGREAFPEIPRPRDPADREPVRFKLQRRKTEGYDFLHHLRFSDPIAAQTPAARQATSLLREALDDLEQRHGAAQLHAVLDVSERPEQPDPQRDLDLLLELSDIVSERRSKESV